jgi:transposase
MPKPGPRTTTATAMDFKATALRLSQLRGASVQEVAESLYIHPFLLCRWRKEARERKIMTKGVDVDRRAAAELKEAPQDQAGPRAPDDRVRLKRHGQ